MIASDLKAAGFDVRKNIVGGLIVSLIRFLSAGEVRRALNHAGYDDCQFSAKPYNGMVIVNAVTA